MDCDKLMQCYIMLMSFALHQIGQVNDKLNILRWVGLQGSISLKQANSLSVPVPNNVEQNSQVPYVNMIEKGRVDRWRSSGCNSTLI